MSHAATKWAIEQRGLKPAAKIVLWQLCDRFHPDNGCFPSQETLAEDCEMARSTLNAHLAALEARGLLAREVRRDPHTKQQERTRYRFPFEADFEPVKGASEETAASEEPSPETGRGAESGKSPEPCPENEQSRVRNPDTNPVREPVREPIEREARVRDPEPDPETDQDFQALLAKVSRAAGPQPTGRCFPLWRRLDDDSARKAALDGWESCLAEWSKGGRKHPYGLETYLRDRLWTQAPKVDAESGPKVMLELRSGEWFAVFWARFLNGDLKACGSMISFAKMRVGAPCLAEELPSRDVIAAMPKIDKNSEAWRAWRQRLHGAGLRIDDDHVPKFVWVPSEWPPGMQAGSDDALIERERAG